MHFGREERLFAKAFGSGARFGLTSIFVLLCHASSGNAGPPVPGQLEAPKLDPFLQQCRELLEAEKVHETEPKLREYLRMHSDSADAHFLLGYALFRNAHARDSLAEYTEGAKYRRPNATDLRVVGADYVLLADYPDADKWFTKSLEWEPRSVIGWYYLGRTKYYENRFEEAISAFEQCLKLDPRHIKAEDNLGLAYEGLGHYDEAIACYKNAIAWQSGSLVQDPGPFVNLGTVLLQQKNAPSEALELLQKAVAMEPKDAKAHQQLGKAYYSLNRLLDAQTQLETASRLAPKASAIHYLLAQVYRKQGFGEKAKAEFDLCNELMGTHSAPDTPEQYHVPVQ